MKPLETLEGQKVSLEGLMEQKMRNESNESRFGYHFITEYLENPWKFYLKRVLGLRRKGPKKAALGKGTLVHAAVEAAWRTEEKPSRIWEAMEELAKKMEMEPADVQGARMMFSAWANGLQAEQEERFYFVGAEVPLLITLPNGFQMTGTLDRLFGLKASPEKLVPVETKTTGWSLDKMFESVRNGDQVVVYWLGVSQRWPDREVAYVLPEIMYQKGSVAKAGSPSIIDVPPRTRERLERNLIGSFGRLYQSLRLLEAGWPPEVLFPRNPNTATEVNFGNEYADVTNLATGDYQRIEYLDKMGWVIEDTRPKLQDFMESWEKTEGWDVFFRLPERKKA